MEELYLQPYIVTTFFDESAVLLDTRRNIYYALNQTAAEFLQALSQTHSFEKSLKVVLAYYETAAEDIRGDMAALVDSLLQSGLLKTVKQS